MMICARRVSWGCHEVQGVDRAMGGQTNFEFACPGRMTIVRLASGSASGKLELRAVG